MTRRLLNICKHIYYLKYKTQQLTRSAEFFGTKVQVGVSYRKVPFVTLHNRTFGYPLTYSHNLHPPLAYASKVKSYPLTRRGAMPSCTVHEHRAELYARHQI
jgi:hypothetical protein